MGASSAFQFAVDRQSRARRVGSLERRIQEAARYFRKMDSSDEEEMRRLRSSATYATAAEERRRHRRCAAAALDSNDPRLSRSLASSQNRASRVSSSSSSDDDAFGPSPPKPFPGGERQGAAAGALLERAASTPSSEDEDPDALCRAVLPEELEAAGLPSCFGGRPSFSVARACAGKGSGGGPRCTDSAAARSGRWVSLKAHFSRPLKELCGAGEGGEETLASLPVVAEFALHLHSPGLATAFALAPKGNRMVSAACYASKCTDRSSEALLCASGCEGWE